jgi:hypothetical protein
MLTLFLIGLPTLAVETWAGFKLFGRLDEAAFRRIVLALFADFRAEPAGPRPISEGRTGHSRPTLAPRPKGALTRLVQLGIWCPQ